jgi:hypothetical protein
MIIAVYRNWFLSLNKDFKINEDLLNQRVVNTAGADCTVSRKGL